MKLVTKNPHQSIKVRHRLKFSEKLLDRAYGSTEKLVAPILALYRSDGWSDPRCRPILNLWHQREGLLLS